MGLYFCLLTLCLKANPDPVVEVKNVSADFFGLMFSHLTLIFILWYKILVPPMLGEQLCQTLPRLGYLCSSWKIKQ